MITIPRGTKEDDYRPCPIDGEPACKGCIFSAPCPKKKTLNEIIYIFRSANPDVK